MMRKLLPEIANFLINNETQYEFTKGETCYFLKWACGGTESTLRLSNTPHLSVCRRGKRKALRAFESVQDLRDNYKTEITKTLTKEYYG